MKLMRARLAAIGAILGGLMLRLTTCAGEAGVPIRGTDDLFKTAVAAWQMDGLKDVAGRHELKVVGEVAVGVPLIGAESIGGRVNAGWSGLMIDHVAIWNRALSDPEIERLSGGSARVAARAAAY